MMMTHFALVTDGIVQRVESVVTAVIEDETGTPQEAIGQEFMATLYPDTAPDQWVRTYYPVGQPDPYPRGKYAGQGDIWDGMEFKSPVVPDPMAPTSSPVLVSN